MIRLEKLSKCFIQGDEEIRAVDAMSLHVKSGEFVVLQGASGSGKSTVLSLIAGLSRPSSGDVIVEGKHISKLPDALSASFRREHIGFIFQKYNLIPNMSAKDNIALPLIPHHFSTSKVQLMVQEAMEKFSIAHKANMLVKHLSGGEQQRVAIARAMVNHPKIILADEPTANLDAKLSSELVAILKQLKAEQTTIVVATHDPLFFDLACVDTYVKMQTA